LARRSVRSAGHSSTLCPPVEIGNHAALDFRLKENDDSGLGVMVDEPHRRVTLSLPFRVSALNFVRPDFNRSHGSSPLPYADASDRLENAKKVNWLRRENSGKWPKCGRPV
jgi:hypothetical protein